MKKMFLTLMAAALVSTSAVAQEEKQDQRPEKKFDKTEMVKHRTDDMVERYSLNDKQAKQLLELNNKYADKMGPRGGRPPRGPEGAPGRPPKDNSDAKGQRPEPPKDGQHPTPPMDGKHKELHKQMEETMKAYDAELQKIMTAEQFKSYQADMKKRHEQHGKHHAR